MDSNELIYSYNMSFQGGKLSPQPTGTRHLPVGLPRPAAIPQGWRRGFRV